MQKKEDIPPVVFERLLIRFVADQDKESLTGDFREMFSRISKKKGKWIASGWYIIHLIKLTAVNLFQRFIRSFYMLGNYIKIAFRNIVRHKGHSFINIGGLSIGIACSLLLFIWVYYEFSYDSFHINSSSIYRVVTERTTSETYTTPNTPGAFAPSVKDSYPEVINAARLFFTRFSVKYGEKSSNIYQEMGLFADKSFFNIFTFPLITGDPDIVLTDPNSIVISRKMSENCFGGMDPIGRTLLLNNRQTCIVTGVFENVPDNSHMEFSYILPIERVRENGFDLDDWSRFAFKTYLLLEQDVDFTSFNDKIRNIYDDYSPSGNPRPILQSLEDIHLYHSGTGLIRYLYIFAITGIVVLAIACINFMNLRTASSGKRSIEIGLRKVLGADRTSIVRQFYCETVLISFIAIISAIVITILLLPVFNDLVAKELKAGLLLNKDMFTLIGAIALFTGIAAGSYPALFLSSFQPASVIKGVTKKGGMRAANFRRILVITQFSLSVILIIGSIVITKQLDFINNKNLGFDKENLLLMRMNPRQYESVRNELLKNPSIVNITKTNAPLLWLGYETTGITWEGKGAEEIMTIQLRTVDYDYLETMGMEMKEGRFFQREYAADSSQGFIVNEAAVRIMGIEDPVGSTFAIEGGKRGRIIGVVKDFHHHSMRDKIEPLLLYIHRSWYSNMFVRVAPGKIEEAMALLRTNWEWIDPGYPFQVSFFDERVERMYMEERKAGNILNVFTIMGIFIAALGLYGLASYMAEQRTKEIGIRRVLGAKVSTIVRDLIEEFTKWVLISNAIAWPIAYITVKKWLQNFAYRTTVGPEVFICAGLIMLVTALITVAYRTIKAAAADPVKSLRYE